MPESKDILFHIISIILAIAAFLTILIVGWRTDLLRDGKPGVIPDGKTEEIRPYSFHKFQLWLWTLIICPAFVLYWGYASPHKPDINETGLILLGISGATAVAAQIIDSTQKNNPAANPFLKSLNGITTGFWSDILKDDTGQLSIGRLQQLIFTLIYVGIYVCLFFQEMKYPDFDKNAYILMGISTGTYLITKGFNK